jgi:hypothetical protein
MCRNKQEFVKKGKNEVNMPCHYKRKQASNKPGEKGPRMNTTTKQNEPNITRPHSPAPYRSRSAVSPVNAPLAMVLIWLLHKYLHRQTTA